MDFVLVSVLVAAMFLGVIQVAIVLHVRSTLIDSAAEGARLGGRADRGLADGEARTVALAGAALGERYTRDVSATYEVTADVRTVRVTVRAPLPVIGFWGPSGVLTVDGHALVEELP
ncbi:TadE family protein [Sanguibacter sp. 25GB23B1]|uniref:TadE family protein n=1 Tax=unclassified Sanguibacter TaxID=2645534 RepID=UPI0032AF88B5